MLKALPMIILVFAQMAAAQSVVDFGIHRQWESIRALGMGNAFTAIADDYNGLFMNPAGMARLEEGQVNMAMEFGGDGTILNTKKNFDDASKISDETKKMEAYLDAFKSMYGIPVYGRFNLFSGVWVRPGWGFAIIPMDFTIDMVAHNQVSPQLNMSANQDTTIIYGRGFDDNSYFSKSRLSLGWNAKIIKRSSFQFSASAIDMATDSNILPNDALREGTTFDGDIGALITPEIPPDGLFAVIRLARPTFSMVVRNVLDMGFQKTGSSQTAPENLHRVLDLGSRWEYPELGIFGGRGTMDFRDIGHPNCTFRKSFHAGLELNWKMAGWWKGAYRFGINQGYPTFGFSALLTVFNLDFATWGEDVGTPNNPRESRRYSLKFNIDI